MLLPQLKAFELLKKYNIDVPRMWIAQNTEQAVFVAENVKYPVVVKIDSPDIVHKSDIGCVRIAYNEDELKTSFISVMRNASKVTKSKNLNVVVQEFLSGYECIIGASYDKQFGPVIMFGSGGVMTELLKNVVFRLIPINESDANSMIEETNISKLANFRGKKVDLNNVVKALLAVSDLMQTEEIKELDINPMFLGERIVAADARIIL